MMWHLASYSIPMTKMESAEHNIERERTERREHPPENKTVIRFLYLCGGGGVALRLSLLIFSVTRQRFERTDVFKIVLTQILA
jgi:hypothetical protein